jgi:hypothetical protein
MSNGYLRDAHSIKLNLKNTQLLISTIHKYYRGGVYSGFSWANIPGFIPVYSNLFRIFRGTFSKGIVWTDPGTHFLNQKKNVQNGMIGSKMEC